MKTGFFKKFVCIGVVFLLLSCLNNPSNNEKNFSQNKEDAQTAGHMVIESFKELDSLSSFFELAQSGLSPLSIENEISLTELSKLAKKSLSNTTNSKDMGSTMTIDFNDTSSGKIYIIFSISTNYIISNDTVVVKWDDYAKNDIQNDENIISIYGAKIYPNGKKVDYRITDLDNDGVIFGESQYNGIVQLNYQSSLENITERVVLKVSSGTDKKFDTDEDNEILELGWEKIIGGKVYAKASFEDADMDGALLDKSKEESSIIDVNLEVKNPPLKPFVDSIFLKIRVLTKGNGKDTIIGLSGKEYRISGRIITLELKDIHGNIDVMPFDTAVAILATIPVLPNGWQDTIKFVFDVQSGLQNASDNLIYELYISKEHQNGIVLGSSAYFVTTQPIHQGEKPKSGHMEMNIKFTKDKNASLVADFTEVGFSGVYTDPDGNTLTIIWDENGNIVSSN